jgi:pimeloyl-ACP methyl ester carboxylesterase
MAGELDAKYVGEAMRAVALLPNAEMWICPDAGHRVPWEQPDRFVERIRLLE